MKEEKETQHEEDVRIQRNDGVVLARGIRGTANALVEIER